MANDRDLEYEAIHGTPIQPTPALSAGYMQRIGPDSCLRCDYVTDASKSFDEQDADLHKHLDEKHPGWMTDRVTTAIPTKTGKLTETQMYEASIRLQGQFKQIPTVEFIEGLAELIQYSITVSVRSEQHNTEEYD